MLSIGPYQIDSQVLLAPMAGVTDLPFRRLCRRFGAGLTTSEMITSDTRLWQSRKSSTRLVVEKQNYPVSMQIAGSDPVQLADAAQACVEHGADIVDINMGCPAKKVCKKAAGSALLADEALVEKILKTVVDAVTIPVTLKTRTGTHTEHKNGVRIAKIAESCGIQALAIHGRTRACKFNGEAEYNTIKQIVSETRIPVFANGDINNALKAKKVLEQTGAAALMLGRAALGQPWIFQEIKQALSGNDATTCGAVNTQQKQNIILEHVRQIHTFYGEHQGVRLARKHFGWYCAYLPDGEISRKTFNQLEQAEQQLRHIKHYFSKLVLNEEKAA